MKSFNKFLQEAYINEEIPANMTRDQFNRLPSATRRRLTGNENAPAFGRAGQELNTSQTSPAVRAARNAAPEVAATNDIASSTTQPNIEPKVTKVPSPAKSLPTGKQLWARIPAKPKQQYGLPKEGPSSRLPGRTLAPAGGTTPRPALPPAGSRVGGGALATRPVSTPSAPVGSPSNPQRINLTPVSRSTPSTPTRALPSATPRALPAAGNTTAVSRSQRALDAAKTQWAKPGAKLGLIGKGLGVAGSALDAGFEYAGQKERGRSTASAATMGVTKAAGGWAGAAGGAKAGAALGAGVGALFGGVGAAPGAAIGGLVGGIAGYTAGSELTGKATETIAGATGKEKAAMATANRQRQAGSAVKGIGGQTTFSQAKPGGPAFMSTGVGSQRRTAQLANTGVVQRGGQSTAGHLAFKGGKAVYKAGPSAQSLARTSSNPLERIGRSLFAGAYKKHDIAKSHEALQKARQSDVARNKKLGVKFKPGG